MHPGGAMRDYIKQLNRTFCNSALIRMQAPAYGSAPATPVCVQGLLSTPSTSGMHAAIHVAMAKAQVAQPNHNR